MSRRILLVEDEFVIADEMEGWLRQAGAEVVGPIPDVEQALDLINEAAGALDAAVLDANLGVREAAYPIADWLEELSVSYPFATGDVQLVSDLKCEDRSRLEKLISQRELFKTLSHLLRSQSAHSA